MAAPAVRLEPVSDLRVRADAAVVEGEENAIVAVE